MRLGHIRFVGHQSRLAGRLRYWRNRSLAVALRRVGRILNAPDAISKPVKLLLTRR